MESGEGWVALEFSILLKIVFSTKFRQINYVEHDNWFWSNFPIINKRQIYDKIVWYSSKARLVNPNVSIQDSYNEVLQFRIKTSMEKPYSPHQYK